jgi:hypothetical protein
MSLATYASEFNNEGMENNPIQKKRDNIRNKTLKRRDNTQAKPVSKVEALMKKIHNNGGDYHDDDDDDESSNNFQPIQHPNSVGIERMENNNEQYNNDTVNNAMMYGDDSVNVKVDDSHQNENHMGQEGFTQLPSEYAKQYYQQYVPYFNQSSDDVSPNGANKDELLNKLNQVIYLLEEQQDEKTGRVTEELILYSFLGIFIIFIVDSFARVGKYVR